MVGLFLLAQHRLAYAVAVVIDVFARSIHPFEPVHRDHLLSMKKLFAEGSLEKSKVILGWELDFCTLTVALIEEKFREQTSDIKRMISSGKITVKELDTVIRRNGYACQVLKQGLHFQNRLRLRVKGQKIRKCAIKLLTRDVDDLKLWFKFCRKVHAGVSFNLIISRQPTKMYLSDSYPYGLGGFQLIQVEHRELNYPRTCQVQIWSVFFHYPNYPSALMFHSIY